MAYTFCLNCDTNYSETDATCPKCGKTTKEQIDLDIAKNKEKRIELNGYERGVKDMAKRQENREMDLIAAFVILIAFIAVGLFCIFY